jgi:ribosomal protein L34E
MGRLTESPELRWFEEQNHKCGVCGKRSQGILRGSRNESYGHHCKRCAEKRLKASAKVREEIAHDRS